MMAERGNEGFVVECLRGLKNSSREGKDQSLA